MKKIGYLSLMAAAGAIGLMTYSLMNKSTSRNANKLVNDMLIKTDQFVKGK